MEADISALVGSNAAWSRAPTGISIFPLYPTPECKPLSFPANNTIRPLPTASKPFVVERLSQLVGLELDDMLLCDPLDLGAGSWEMSGGLSSGALGALVFEAHSGQRVLTRREPIAMTGHILVGHGCGCSSRQVTSQCCTCWCPQEWTVTVRLIWHIVVA